MKYQPDNELLSAYLDDELTAAERVQVEKMLAENPAARQLVDELRALRASLQSLPPRKLPGDLSETVLQTATARQTASSPRQKTPASQAAFLRRLADRFKDNPRMVVWPLVVLSVAILLMVFNPDQPGPGGNGGRQIAKTQTDKKTKASNNDERASDIKILAPKPGEVVQSEDPPAMSAVGPTNSTDKASKLVMKGPGGEKSIQPSAISRADVVVLQCQVSGETLKAESYRKIFESSGIALPKESASEFLHLSTADLAEVTGIEAKVLAANPQADAQPAVKMVAVEATSDQIVDILNSLQTMPEIYLEVSIKTPQPNPGQPAPPPSAKKRVLVVFRLAE